MQDFVLVFGFYFLFYFSSNSSQHDVRSWVRCGYGPSYILPCGDEPQCIVTYQKQQLQEQEQQKTAYDPDHRLFPFLSCFSRGTTAVSGV